MPINFVQLTLEEYDNLKEVQKKATTIVEQTNINLKASLDIANKKIEELEADLRKYAIGGARMKPEQEDKPLDWYAVSDVVEELMTPTQIRGKAKLGRRRWTNHEIVHMKEAAKEKRLLVDEAFNLNRTVSSIKTQASRMGLSSANGILSVSEK